MGTQTTDINKDPDCCRVGDTDMALSYSSGLEDAMVLGSTVGYSDQHDSVNGMSI